MIVAGFDEAGYGPKLGPLVVGCTAFEVPDPSPVPFDPHVPPEALDLDLWKVLGKAVRRRATGHAWKVWVADSKEIKPKKDGLKQLELGVLAFRESAADLTLERLLADLGAPCPGLTRQRWFAALGEVRLPAYAWPGEVASRATRLRAACLEADVTYLGAAARVLDATTYNQRLAHSGNKAEVLAEATIDLLRALRLLRPGPLDVTIDKHGGRNAYARLLGRAFPLCPLDVLEEGAESSAYRVNTPAGPVRVRFRQQAEDDSLPVALASMHCKYLREVLMGQFNAWFGARVPGLKETAGYAQDAGRWLEDVAGALPGLGVSLDTLVRAR